LKRQINTDFVKSQFLPNLQGVLLNGQIIFWGDGYFTFAYLNDLSKITELKQKMKFEIL
jgi:hypothetical protein